MSYLQIIVLLLVLAARASTAAESWEALLASSDAELVPRQERFESEHRVTSFERWDLNQKSGQLIFSSGGQPRLVAQFQAIGSYSSRDDSWLWAWANPSVKPHLLTSVEAVRQIGEKEGFARLTTPKLPATQQDCWQLAGVVAHLFKAEGIYLAPLGENGPVAFLLVTSIQPASNEGEPPSSSPPRQD